MVVQEDIPMMELFRKSVNASREALTKVEVREELTYHYAIPVEEDKLCKNVYYRSKAGFA